MNVVVGLGNPGKEYENTRHNMGFEVIDHLAVKLGVKKWENKFNALFARGTHQSCPFMLVKPQTFMNLSGKAVQPLMAYFKAELEELVIVVDDLDLTSGKIRTRMKGSEGGHNGLRSISQSLGTREYKRIRIGIGRPETGESVLKRVLHKARDAEEEILLSEAVEQAADIALKFIENQEFENWSSP